jgi:hypothetical protein
MNEATIVADVGNDTIGSKTTQIGIISIDMDFGTDGDEGNGHW